MCMQLWTDTIRGPTYRAGSHYRYFLLTVIGTT